MGETERQRISETERQIERVRIELILDRSRAIRKVRKKGQEINLSNSSSTVLIVIRKDQNRTFFTYLLSWLGKT